MQHIVAVLLSKVPSRCLCFLRDLKVWSPCSKRRRHSGYCYLEHLETGYLNGLFLPLLFPWYSASGCGWHSDCPQEALSSVQLLKWMRDELYIQFWLVMFPTWSALDCIWSRCQWVPTCMSFGCKMLRVYYSDLARWLRVSLISSCLLISWEELQQQPKCNCHRDTHTYKII